MLAKITSRRTGRPSPKISPIGWRHASFASVKRSFQNALPGAPRDAVDRSAFMTAATVSAVRRVRRDLVVQSPPGQFYKGVFE
jgi:hypothetical protein